MIRHSCDRSVVRGRPAAEFQHCLGIDTDLMEGGLDLTRRGS